MFGEVIKTRHFQKSQLGNLSSSVLLLAASSAFAQNPVPSISTPLFPESLARLCQGELWAWRRGRWGHARIGRARRTHVSKCDGNLHRVGSAVPTQ